MGEAATERIVRRFGEYALGRCIGTGGMASVYAARQEKTLGVGRMVALKILHPSVAPDTAQRTLFRREASLATRLEHPGIVRTYDVGEASGQLYMAMELLHGATLSSLRAGPVPPPVALRILEDVARALQYAHELAGVDGQPLGLVHQDVTPQNVIVGYDGRVRLLDFGVARLGSVDTSRTEHVRGKPAYLAPEQIEGARLDRRVDVFALGTIAHELLTGVRLFRRDTISATYHAVLVEPIPDVRDIRPEVPEGIALAVARALRRDPATRWPSAEAFRQSLVEARSRHGVSSVDEGELARWIADVVPPDLSPSHLEREILDQIADRDIPDRPTVPPEIGIRVIPEDLESRPTAPIDLSSRPTVPEPRPAVGGLVEDGGEDEVPLQRPRLALGVALAAVILGALGLILHNGATPAPAPSVSPFTEAPPPASVPAPPPIGSDPVAAPPPPQQTLAPGSARVSSGHAAKPAPAKSKETPSPVASEPSAPTPSPAPLAKGFINVWSSAWGHVDIDGKPVGDSPVAHVPLAPGPHTVHIASPDHGEQTQTVVVQPDTDARVRFVF